MEEVPVLACNFKTASACTTLPLRRVSYDRLTAAHALSHDLIVVTDDEADYRDVPDVRVESRTI